MARTVMPGTLGGAILEAPRMSVLGGEIVIDSRTHTIDNKGDVYLQHM
jgi:hypothetical protein